MRAFAAVEFAGGTGGQGRLQREAGPGRVEKPLAVSGQSRAT